MLKPKPKPTFYLILTNAFKERVMLLKNLKFERPVEIAAREFFIRRLNKLLADISTIPRYEGEFFNNLDPKKSINDEVNAVLEKIEFGQVVDPLVNTPLLGKINTLVTQCGGELFEHLARLTANTAIISRSILGVAALQSFVDLHDPYSHSIKSYQGMLNALPESRFNGREIYFALLKNNHYCDKLITALSDLTMTLNALRGTPNLDSESRNIIVTCTKATEEAYSAIRRLREPDEKTGLYSSRPMHELAVAQSKIKKLQNLKTLKGLFFDNTKEPTELSKCIELFNATLTADLSYLIHNEQIISQKRANDSKKISDLKLQTMPIEEIAKLEITAAHHEQIAKPKPAVTHCSSSLFDPANPATKTKDTRKRRDAQGSLDIKNPIVDVVDDVSKKNK